MESDDSTPGDVSVSVSNPHPEVRSGRCDLHVHTTFSDGILSPEEMVRRARHLGLAAIAISDHDAVGGIDPAQREGRLTGVEVVPAVELSCVTRDRDVHILGFYIDHHDPDFVAFLARAQSKRRERAGRMVDNLNRMGIKVSFERVLAIAGAAAVGRPHLAQAMVEAGSVKNLDEAFETYISSDSPAYVHKMEISPLEAVDIIRRFRGVAVAAHPGSYHERFPGVLDELIESGLAGIEVYHPDHNPDQCAQFLDICRRHNLLVTGGSDCHGGRKGRVILGEVTVPYSDLTALKRRAGKAA